LLQIKRAKASLSSDTPSRVTGSQSDLSTTFDERNMKEVAFFTLDP